MLKKIIQVLLILILLSILTLIFIFAFNPAELRTKIISNVLNSYLSKNIENYTPLDNSSIPNNSNEPTDKHPLLNEEQEKILENLGINVSQLPTEITPAMTECFTEKLGAERAEELVNGATPGPLDIFKAKDCLNK